MGSQDQIDSPLSIQFVITDPSLCAEFRKYIEERYAVENLMFYQAVLNFERSCASGSIEFGVIKEMALELANLYLKSTSQHQINISSLQRRHLLDMLELNDGPDDFGSSVSDQADLVEDRRKYSDNLSDDSEDEFMAHVKHQGTSFGKLMSSEELQTPVRKALTKEDLTKMFEEAKREVATLIDRNFMSQFQHERKMKEWFKSARDTKWSYSGFLTLKMVKLQFQQAYLENATVSTYLKDRRMLFLATKEPVGKSHFFVKDLKVFYKTASSDMFQARFPLLGRIALRLESGPKLRLKALDAHNLRMLEIQRQWQEQLDLFLLQKDNTFYIDEEKYNKMRTLYEKLTSLTSSENKLTRGYKARGQVRGTADEQETLQQLAHNKRETWRSLSEIEDSIRGEMNRSFYALESLDFTRMESTAKAMAAVRYSEMKLFSTFEVIAQHSREDADYVFDAEKHTDFFVFRNHALKQDFSTVDPIQGSLNLDPEDLEYFFGIIDIFQNTVKSYVESSTATVNAVAAQFFKILVGGEKVAMSYTRESLKLLGNTHFGEQLIDLLTGNGITKKYNPDTQIVQQVKERWTTLSAKVVKELADTTIALGRWKDAVHMDKYISLFEKYLKACSVPHVAERCAQLREARVRHQKLGAKLQYATAAEEPAIFQEIEEVATEIEYLEQGLAIPIKARKKVVNRKREIVKYELKHRMKTIRKCMEVVAQNELDIIALMNKEWSLPMKNIDIVEEMEWVGENVIARDMNNIMGQMASTLLMESISPVQWRSNNDDLPEAKIISEPETAVSKRKKGKKQGKKGFGFFGKTKKRG